MILQNQIKRTLSEPEAIKRIKQILEIHANATISKVGELVCNQFNFFDPNGKKQISGCLKALRSLSKKGFFVLPVHTKKIPVTRTPCRLDEPVAEPEDVPNEVGKISELKLIYVATEENMRIWNELMIQDHPRGAGPLVGRQIRYLIQSEHGWLGGISFSSAIDGLVKNN